MQGEPSLEMAAVPIGAQMSAAEPRGTTAPPAQTPRLSVVSGSAQEPSGPYRRPVQRLREYPELRRIRARQAEREAAATKAAAYVRAAEAIIDVDEDEATRLIRMAQQVEGDPPTAVELELLELAEAIDWEA